MVQAYCAGATLRDDLQRRHVRKRDTHDGMVKIEAVLPPEEAELLWAALDHAAKTLIRPPAAVASSPVCDAAESLSDPESPGQLAHPPREVRDTAESSS